MVFSNLKIQNKWQPKPHDVRVRPWKHHALRWQTEKLRKDLGIRSYRVKIPRVLDALGELKGITYAIIDDGDDNELTYVHSLARGRHIKFKTTEFEALDDPLDPLYNRIRYTAIHEACHALNHHNIGNNGLTLIYPPRARYESAECEANAFASHFLMPVGAVKLANFEPNKLCQLCHVSWEAASIRCQFIKEKGW